LTRSPAAHVVGELAERSGLFLSHFEHRVPLELPEHWLPTDRPELGRIPSWQNGVLPEAKYQAFRHDLMVGSFHPGHRAKWTAHELCHGLLGFAWKPGASRYFHALAARLAEVLPVALWYFFDEHRLKRCAAHAGQGPLFRYFCADCESAAALGPEPADTSGRDWYAEGMAFVEREIDAVHRSLKRGRMEPNRLYSIDLASDALAYAGAHGERLASEEFERFVSLFSAPKWGHHDSLDSLITRTRDLCTAITDGDSVEVWQADASIWATQDVGWRLLSIRAETDGDAMAALDDVVEHLAKDPTEHGLLNAIRAYESISQEWELPEPSALFAVGYGLPAGYGRSETQVWDGLQSAVPVTCSGITDEVRAFVAADLPAREPLARRFAAYLADKQPRILSDVARFEAALSAPKPPDIDAISLVDDALKSSSFVRGKAGEILRFESDVPAAVEVVMGGGELNETGGPMTLAVLSFADGDVGLIDLSPGTGSALAEVPVGGLVQTGDMLEHELELLIEHGVLLPAAYTA